MLLFSYTITQVEVLIYRNHRKMSRNNSWGPNRHDSTEHTGHEAPRFSSRYKWAAGLIMDLVMKKNTGLRRGDADPSADSKLTLNNSAELSTEKAASQICARSPGIDECLIVISTILCHAIYLCKCHYHLLWFRIITGRVPAECWRLTMFEFFTFL